MCQQKQQEGFKQMLDNYIFQVQTHLKENYKNIKPALGFNNIY